MRSNLTRRQIFELVANREITTGEGIELINSLVPKSLPVHYYQPEWAFDKPMREIAESSAGSDGPLLIFQEQDTVGRRIGSLRKQKGSVENEIVVVQPGTGFEPVDEWTFRVNPLREDDYHTLAAQLETRGIRPANICYLWSASEEEAPQSPQLFPLLYMAKSLASFKSLKRFLYIYFKSGTMVNPMRECAASLGPSLGLVYPQIQFSSIQVAGYENQSPEVSQIVDFELGRDFDATAAEIFYDTTGRHVKRMKKVESSGPVDPFIKERGVYLITGGGGALGFIFARYLAEQYKATLVLTDLAAIDSSLQKRLDELEALGSKVYYFQADVSDKSAMETIVTEVRTQCGSINGVIHAAGTNNDIPLTEKDEREFLKTLKPKIDGTIVLDEVTKGDKLDFFVLFSSSASIFGDFGQCDYSIASRFMDGYRRYREILVEQSERNGLCCVINWHLWKDGGMHLSPEGESLYLASSGMGYLEAEDGLRSFEEIVSRRFRQTLVISGDPSRLDQFFNIHKGDSHTLPNVSIQEDLEEVLGKEIREIGAGVIKLDPLKLGMEETLGDFGFDSISLKAFADQLNSRYDIRVSPALFFKHPNLNSLTNYLLDNYKAEISRVYAIQPSADPSSEPRREYRPVAAFRPSGVGRRAFGIPKKPELERDDIAIIGAGGMFPGSADLAEFWKNLREGKDLISEAPKERWNWSSCGVDGDNDAKRLALRWGGFISDVDTFDARFFNISPREAELMDPQNRLFLEICWRTIEDAGYDVSQLSGGKIGVFAGVQFSDYEQLLRDSGPVTAQVGTGNSHAMICNRVSYAFDFRGPSEAIDTACSGSLVAVNRAVRSVRAGECDMALCGGVSLILSPDNILAAAQLGVLSPDGRCKTFDRSANGYVKGEGVGAVLIKPLREARASGDHIYAVIKGSAVNHGGKANSLTAPNSESQADVLAAAYKDAGIGIESVSYIETHGTGTELGDPVEIEGLKNALEKLAAPGNGAMMGNDSCGLGSVKTNIGHLEPASGIAGLIKVILAMKHRMIPPSLHLKDLNPYIDFTETPFYVVDRRIKWERRKDKLGRDIPLRAGVSSFGFGGANAHVVLEEYRDDEEIGRRQGKEQEQHIVILSAKDQNRLVAYAQKLARYLENINTATMEETPGNGQLVPKLQADLSTISSEILSVEHDEIDADHELREYGFEPVHFADLAQRINEKYNFPVTINDLTQHSTIGTLSEFLARQSASPVSSKKIAVPFGLLDVAYTLQLGRLAMKSRLAIVVSSLDELIEGLKKYTRGDADISGLFLGEANQNSASQLLLDGHEWNEYIGIILRQKKLSKIAKLWVSGVDIDWTRLYEGRSPRRLSLPTYPFLRQRFWIPGDKDPLRRPAAIEPVSRLHPLVHRNTSTFREQRYSTQLEGNEFFLRDHIVDSKKVLPGVAYIEMARAAAELATGRKVGKIKNIVWINPVVVDHKPVRIHIGLAPDKADENRAQFEIYNRDGEGPRLVHSRGRLEFATEGSSDNEKTGASIVDVDSLARGLNQSMGRNVCYSMFNEAGIAYGPSFQAIQQIYCSGDKSIARIELPADVQGSQGDFGLHPSVMDAAFQTVMGLRDAGGDSMSTYLPFSVGEVEVLDSLPEKCYVHVTPGDGSMKPGAAVRTFNIEILDPDGRRVVQIRDFTVKELKGGLQEKLAKPVYFVPAWTKGEPVPDKMEEKNVAGKTILLLAQELGFAPESTKTILARPGTDFNQKAPENFEINPNDESHFIKLFEILEANGQLPDMIVHLWSFDNHEESDHNAMFVSLFLIAREMMRRKPKSEVKCLYLFPGSTGDYRPEYSAMAGFCRSLQREHPKFLCKTIELENSNRISHVVINELSGFEGDVEVRYDSSMERRYVRVWEELSLDAGATNGGGDLTSLLKSDEGVYLITGGLGKLGMILAEYLAGGGNVRLALTDRWDPTEESLEKIDAIRSSGAQVQYWAADLSKKEDVENLVAQVKECWGQVNGVIHCAGVNRDAPVVDKSVSQAIEVLGPKVYGARHLDEATKNESLDFFVLFSSFTSVVGNAGQSDYGYANNFLDHFAGKREMLRRQGARSGHTVSINWPLWKFGGMTVDTQTERLMATTIGMVPLSTEIGLGAFNRILESGCAQVAVIVGDGKKIRRVVASGNHVPVPITGEATSHAADRGELALKIQNDLMTIAMGILKMPAEDIDCNLELQEYGFDSITLTEFANNINETLGLEITPAVFFELDQSTIAALGHHLCEKYRDSLPTDYFQETKSPVHIPVEEGDMEPEPTGCFNRFECVVPEENTRDMKRQFDVAIVGMNAQMPGSEDLDSFWEHLVKGSDLISEVPAHRWDWKSLFGQQSGARWGGFMEDIDTFDPLFFGISHREAELMDPQQRLILKTVWAAIEDAGYRASVLSGVKAGVFIGVSTTDYYELWRSSTNLMEPYMATGMSHSIVANRISYLLNLRGPSESVDTACSSSLVAIYRGVEAIQRGSCDMVIAGGVNLLISPTLFQAFDSAGMLSADGRCRTFDQRANGYVRGEGVGAILMKPLDRAISDRDHVYGIVKGGALNHGGRANSLTAPNANAQADLLVEAYRNAGMDPSTIGYIEAHGTGTTLGDPVEINGLKLAFSRLFEEAGIRSNGNPHLGIGSVKTNIGHLEAAAGIAGVVKVLLAMKYKSLPATIHFQELNHFIDLDGSPFYIQDSSTNWEPLEGENGTEVPRRAGVSSFGFGGANAHIILEEFAEQKRPAQEYPRPYIFILSAKTEQRLSDYAERMLRFLQKTDADLLDVIYTLQVGREPLEERLAIVASDCDDLVQTLDKFCNEENYRDRTKLFRNNIDNQNPPVNSALEGDLQEGGKLAQAWVSGQDVDWEILYPNVSPYRVSLPTYPFEKKRYWFDSFHKPQTLKQPETPVESPAKPGKLVLRQPKEANPVARADGNVKGIVVEHLSRILHAGEGELAEKTPMQEFGLDSIGSVELIKSLNQEFGLDLKTVLLYDYSTIETLTRHIESLGPKRADVDAPPPVKPRLKIKQPESQERGHSTIKERIVQNLCHILHADADEIDHDTPMQEIGLDSIGGTELINGLNHSLSLRLKASVLYDFPTVSKLADHISPLAKVESSPQPPITSQPQSAGQDVAIIGMSARFPGARDVTEFWENLRNGVDSISEVPKSRWDVDRFYDPDPNQPNSIYCKWGGFIDGIDEFDPLFFRISPSDAEVIDPQHRLFMEECVKAFEDAGYSEEELSEKKCGVFVGVLNYNEYSQVLQGKYSDTQLGHLMLGNSNSILAARTCYFLNLKGPALAIDTACSSSLVAIHQAYKSLQNGETEMMLAGGVILCMIHERYLLTSKTGALSPGGRCRTFDNGADGYVPGEGVGVVLMKSLDRALLDRDHIYGVIKGSALNQDGATNGITAPSAESQKNLELEVYDKFNIHPESIQYVEAHGTGTKLGDPIEITALTAAFNQYTKKSQFCAIGSVKTNIGHLASAAGVASVIKVLLSLSHKQIPPSLHFTTPNEHVDFKETPFFVNTESRDWEVDGDSPRRATVSAFGLSGTNCHMVIQEAPVRASESVADEIAPACYMAPFSAKTPEALREKLQRMKVWLEHNGDTASLGDISFTLLAGRSHYEYRYACVVRDIDELSAKLDRALVKDIDLDVSTLDVNEGRALVQELKKREKWSDDDYEEKLSHLTAMYISGANLSWRQLFHELQVRRISLPTYPFSRETFWIQDREDNGGIAAVSTVARLHPFIDANESTFFESKFKLRLKGDEFFITDHVIEGEKIFPAVAYAEMARAAGEIGAGRKVERLKNIIFSQPISIGDQPKDIFINFMNNDGNVEFRISTSGENGQSIERSQGRLIFESPDKGNQQPDAGQLNVEAIKERCSGTIDPEEVYRMFRLGGVTYGDGFQTIKELRYCENEALAKLELTDTLSHSLPEFVMHPSFMDGLLQSTLGIALGDASRLEGTNYLPFVLGDIEFFNRQPLPRTCYAYATRTKVSGKKSAGVMTFNIDLLDSSGRLRIRMKNFSVRAVQEHDLSYMRPVWRKNELQETFSDVGDLFNGPIIVLDGDGQLSDAIHQAFKANNFPADNVIAITAGPCFEQIDEHSFQINPAESDDYKKLWATLEERDTIPAGIIHNWSNPMADSMDTGLFSVFYLVKAIVAQKIPRKIQFLYVSSHDSGSFQPRFSAVSGFTRSIAREHSKLLFKSLELDSPVLDAISSQEILVELATADQSVIRYVGGERLSRRLEPVDSEQNPNPLETGGVYIVTGGAGGLGLIFAQYLAEEYNAHLVLTGRSELDEAKRETIARLDGGTGRVLYMKADVSVRSDVEMLIKKTKEQFNRIDGVIHSAGVIRDSLVKGKTMAEMKQVLAPKVDGTLHLDQCLKDEDLDLFVLFSAVAGEFGNPGQSGYAYANSFLDHFAAAREELRAKGLRRGKTISIDWTLWQDGGMKLDERMLELRREAIGVKPLSTSMGINAFLKALTMESSQLILAHGDESYIQQLHSFRKAAVSRQESRQEKTTMDADLSRRLQSDLVKLVDQQLKMKGSSTDPKKNLREYGFDSINLTVLANRINERYSLEMTPAAFFELETLTLDALTGYILEEYPETAASFYSQSSPVPEAPKQSVPEDIKLAAMAVMPAVADRQPEQRRFPVAIIGMSGRMPRSDSLQEFWSHLEKGRSMISEIPSDRWDWRDYDGNHMQGENKTTCRWGGFMNRVDAFDAKFFSISPREAELMDPQQRLFLETVWQVMEDAGYQASALSESRTGLFVGVSNSDYSHLLAGAVPDIQAQAATGLSHSIIANRVSYWLDLRGPSEVINTACSSSLVAIHRAVESMRNDSCHMAFAGGVNVIASPTVHVAVGKVGILSDDGKCRTFDSGANGIVRGEGVGAVLLKPLAKAVDDGDHIYSVIVGTGENHGGRSTSLTAPNPNAQAALLTDVYTKAGISPDTIGYIECHGTGTRLGDPVEINGLKKAFEALGETFGVTSAETNYCGIGSVKTNVGHLEAAAGIAGVFKVILGMKNKTIPATINFKELNPFIELEGSPFYVVKDSVEWTQPTDSLGNKLTRRAGISSFGLGGTNAHIILEEYEDNESNTGMEEYGPQVVLLSGNSEEILKQYSGNLAEFLDHPSIAKENNEEYLENIIDFAADILAVSPDELDSEADFDGLGFDPVTLSDFSDRISAMCDVEIPMDVFSRCGTLNSVAEYVKANGPTAGEALAGKSEISLRDVAYTSQVGREPQKERLAVICRDIQDLADKLNRFCGGECDGSTGIDGLYRGVVSEDSTAIELLTQNKSGADFVRTIIDDNEIWKLAQLWVMGASIDWSLLHEGQRPKRVSLPTYPFAREGYWLPVNKKVHKKQRDNGPDFFLIPEWTPAPISPGKSEGESIAIFHSADDGGIAEGIKTIHKQAQCVLVDVEEITGTMDTVLERLQTIDVIYFLSGLSVRPFDSDDIEGFEVRQERGVFTLFRLVKALENTRGMKNLKVLKIATNNSYEVLPGEVVNPVSGGLLGFSRSLSRELYNVDISVVDVGIDINSRGEGGRLREKDIQSLATAIANEPPHKNGEIVSIRGENRYVRRMRRATPPPASLVPFRPQGVYLIVGGGRGIGFELCRHLVETVQARVILLGRSPLDDQRKKDISSLESNGGEVLYLQADITDSRGVKDAIDVALSRFGSIHGVVHSAVVLKDKTVSNMDEQELRSVLEPKTNGSVVLNKALRDVNLDFMLFFSSAVSFTSNPGQSNYAAGCAFKDSFAQYLRQERPFAVKTVNWGFWGSVGVVSSEEYIDRMAAQGVGSISPKEGMDVIERLLNSNLDQVIALKADDLVMEKLGVLPEEYIRKEHIKEVQSTDKSAAGPEVKNTPQLGEFLKNLISEVLHYEGDEVDMDRSFTDLGVDSVLAIEVASKISDRLNVELNPAHLYNYSTLGLLTRFIQEELQPGPVDECEDEDERALRLLERLERGEVDVDGVNSEFDMIYKGNNPEH